MNENLDGSVKFERYYLLNHLYKEVYKFSRNIKPAPDPHYTLDKFCGTLSIEEYRTLSSKNQLLFLIDKPMTRVLPELHEDNDDFIISNKIVSRNKGGETPYTVKKGNNEQQTNKTAMMFGIN
jgi:hypothetical protein